MPHPCALNPIVWPQWRRFGVQQGLDKVTNRCGGTALCNTKEIRCCKPQLSLPVPQIVLRLVSCLWLNVVAFVIWDCQLLVVEFLAELQQLRWCDVILLGHSGSQWWLCYFCSEYFSFAVRMPQSVCICSPVPTSKTLLMYEHRAQALGFVWWQPSRKT